MEKRMERVRHVPIEMQGMLRSVFNYNSGFSCDKKLLESILSAMKTVDRKFFVEAGNPYTDSAMSVDKEQTISQPSTVARMLLLAELKKGDDVLEVGACSGWGASLIAYLVYPGRVLSVDRIESLVNLARGNFAELRNFLRQEKSREAGRLDNLSFLAEDIFSKGEIWKKKYNKIIITAGIRDKETERKVEEIAKDLLKQNGLLICPYAFGPLLIYGKKAGDKLEKEETGESYRFVPLLTGMKE